MARWIRVALASGAFAAASVGIVATTDASEVAELRAFRVIWCC